MIHALAYAEDLRTYPSPDGKYLAYIILLQKGSYGLGESRIEIRETSGAVLCSQSYGSEDGEHGFVVDRGGWTPNSQFFVYSMSSSGGHQSWHFPTDFIAVSDFKVRSLDDYLGPITDPDFVLRAPDIVKTTGRRKADLEEADFEVKLSELLSQK